MFASSPELFAGCRVFRRLSMPRHPPYTLKSLATFTDHRHARACNNAVNDACQSPRSLESLPGTPAPNGPTHPIDNGTLIITPKRCSTMPTRPAPIHILLFSNFRLETSNADKTNPDGKTGVFNNPYFGHLSWERQGRLLGRHRGWLQATPSSRGEKKDCFLNLLNLIIHLSKSFSAAFGGPTKFRRTRVSQPT